MQDVGVFAVGSLAILGASFTQGAFGFGFALIASPVLLLVVDSVTAVATTLVLAAGVSLAICIGEFRRIEFRSVLILLVAAVPGAWFGGLFLVVWPSSAIKVVAGGAAVLASLPLLVGYRHRFAHEGIALVSSGLLSGVLTGSTSIGGPPVVLMLANQGWDRDAFRASLGFFFMVISSTTLVILGVQGSLANGRVSLALWYLPVGVVGFVAGHLAAKHMHNVELFRRLAVTIVIVTGLVSIGSGLAEAL